MELTRVVGFLAGSRRVSGTQGTELESRVNAMLICSVHQRGEMFS